MTIQERLREYAEDNHSDDRRASAMNEAADRIDELEKESNLLNVAWLQGEFSELQAKVEILLNEHAERGVRIEELDKCLAGWLSANCETDWIGELRAHAKASVSYMQERDTLKARIDELEKELERERIRLAACGVVALANTPESAAKQREMLPEYHSGSLDQVIHLVDSEMALRKQLEAKQARIDELMIEYCPNEMTPEQWKNYEDHQRPLTDDEK